MEKAEDGLHGDLLYLPVQAAEYLGVSKATLEKWRVSGKGPTYIKMGRSVRYRQSHLQEWLASQKRVSTSDDTVRSANRVRSVEPSLTPNTSNVEIEVAFEAADPTMTVRQLTPTWAAELLGTVKKNRRVYRHVVQRYVRDILSGRWMVNGESIKISKTGRLLDGQHRCLAVIATAVAVRVCVVTGIDDSAIVTLDTGQKRDYHDAATVMGKEYPKEVDAVARWWYRHNASAMSGISTATMQELDDIMTAHPNIVESVRFVAHLKTVRRRCVASVQGFVHSYTTEQWSREQADDFQERLDDGAELEVTSPILLLRKRLVDADRGEIPRYRVLALTIKAWNAWVAGEPMGQLKWPTGGNEAFPQFAERA